MAYLYRLIFCGLCMLCGAASAAISPQVTWEASSSHGTAKGASPEAACAALLVIVQASITNGDVYILGPLTTWGSGYWCSFRPNGSTTGALGGAVGKLPLSCPANSNSNAAGTCDCATNYEEKDGACKKKPMICDPGYENDGHDNCNLIKCKPGEIRVNNICVPDPDLCPDGSQKVDGKCKEKNCKADQPLPVSNSSSMPFAMCDGGCIYQTSNAIVCNENAGVRSCARTYYSTGGTCNDKPGKPGESGGGDNGGDGGSGGEGGGSGGGSGGGGGTGGGGGGGNNDKPDTKPNIPGENPNPDTGKCGPGTYMSGGKCYPNKTDEKPTDNGKDDGKCPTGYRKEGSKCLANQPEPDEDKDKEFCKENPEVSICKKGAFDGSCDGSFKCEGDAIQCAIARDQHIRNCQMFDKETEESKLYYAEKKTGKFKVTNDLEGNRTIDVSTYLSQSDTFLSGGGSCPVDTTIDVMGHSFVLSWSEYCPHLAMLGNVLVMIAGITAAFIVLKRGA